MAGTGAFLFRRRLDEERVVPWRVDIVDVHLQYWPNDNIITDEYGEIIYDVFSIISPSDLAMFKNNPYWEMYFLHNSAPGKVVGISYKDPKYFEEGDYKRYPTFKHQMVLREREVMRFEDRLDDILENFRFRRKIYPELYV